MKKTLLISLSLIACLQAIEIPIDKVKERKFGKSLKLNSKIVQLSSSKQSVMALVGGQIKKYYVKSGEKVQKGQKIALIKSIKLSKMTSEFISLQKQFNSLTQNYNASKELHKKGVVSLQSLNLENIQRDEMLSKLETLKSQLQTLGIDTASLNQTTANYILYAHSSGTISALLQPQHSVISEDTQILSIIKDKSFYLKSYLPLSYANMVKVNQRITLEYNNKIINTKITQILPQLDEKTQRIVVLSSIEDDIKGLFINSYVPSTLYFNSEFKYLTVKKSAITFFNNEWVVFLPKEEKHEEDNNHSKEKEDDHKEESHEKEEDHDESEEEHGENEEQQYEARDIKIIDQDDEYVAIEGLKINEEYVSGKSYFVKSMVLKSSLGEHGH